MNRNSLWSWPLHLCFLSIRCIRINPNKNNSARKTISSRKWRISISSARPLGKELGKISVWWSQCGLGVTSFPWVANHETFLHGKALCLQESVCHSSNTLAYLREGWFVFLKSRNTTSSDPDYTSSCCPGREEASAFIEVCATVMLFKSALTALSK